MAKAFKTDVQYLPIECSDDHQVNLEVSAEKIKYSFIHGTVRCETSGKYLSGMLIKAVNIKTDKHFFAITNKHGFYALCVPPGEYLVYAFCCPSHKSKCRES